MKTVLNCTVGAIVGAFFGVATALAGLPYAWPVGIAVACLIAAGGVWVSRDERETS